MVQCGGPASAVGPSTCSGSGGGGGRAGDCTYVPVVIGSGDTLPLRLGGDEARLCCDMVDAHVVVFKNDGLCDKLCVVCVTAVVGICAVIPEIQGEGDIT